MSAIKTPTDGSDVPFHPRQISVSGNVFADQYLAAAEDLGLESSRFPGEKRTWIISQGNKRLSVRAAILGCNRPTARSISANKLLTHRNMAIGGVRMPAYRHFKMASDGTMDRLREEIRDYCETRYPVVLKTVSGGASSGVIANIVDRQDLHWSMNHLMKHDNREYIVEQYIDGQHYRISAFDGEILAIGCLAFAEVEGDGQNTVEALIEQQNVSRRDNDQAPIVVEERLLHVLEKGGVTLQTVLPKGKTERFSEEVNRIFGTPKSMRVDPARLSATTLKYFAHISRQSGLRWLGIDFICRDIYDTNAVLAGFVNEVNSAPAPAMFRRGVARDRYLMSANTILRRFFRID